MYVVNDFFSLIWEKDAQKMFSSTGDINTFLTSQLKLNYDAFCDYSSIVLIVSSLNIEKLSEIKEPREAMAFLAGFNEWDKQRVQYLQKELLSFLSQKGDKKLNKAIGQRFDRFRKENIIGYDISRQLISILALIEAKKEVIEPIQVIKAKKGLNFYENSINTLCTAIENLKNGIEEKSLYEKLAKIPQKLKDEKFSIGITGVINSGKSTLLNALLGKEILGTSVIPETANISIIKYAKTPRATVNFWTKKEWKSIENSALTLEYMKPFVEETKKYFANNIDEFITDLGLSEDIDIDKLPSFTSAEHSDKKCNLVKSVELYTNLNFLKNGVEIVDTPGLDDPVIQREEITKNYLYDCDLMIHLMNVNQSATQKDIEFITDTLLYQSVVRLLVVITRIDTVSQKELEEVIKFTKESIKDKLKNLNKEAQFSTLIEKIDFIPIAGKMALMHRIGKSQDAINAGYSLEKTGILDIENYLSEVLFGDNSQKANLVVESTRKELLGIAKNADTLLHVEKDLLSKSSNEIENEYKKYQEEIQKTKENIKKLNKSIKNSKLDLISYFLTLDNFAKNKILSLSSLIKRRVTDDILYEFEKHKKRPKEERISYIIDAGIKDGFIDLLRDYKHQFKKKMENEFDKIQREYSDFSKNDESLEDARDFMQKHFSDLNLLNSNLILIKKTNNAIKSHSKKDIDGLNQILEHIFLKAFDELRTKFHDKAEKINMDLVEEFELTCKDLVQDIEFDMRSRDKSIKEAQTKVKDKSFDTSKRLAQIEQKLMLISKVSDEVKSIGGKV